MYIYINRYKYYIIDITHFTNLLVTKVYTVYLFRPTISSYFPLFLPPKKCAKNQPESSPINPSPPVAVSPVWDVLRDHVDHQVLAIAKLRFQGLPFHSTPQPRNPRNLRRPIFVGIESFMVTCFFFSGAFCVAWVGVLHLFIQQTGNVSGMSYHNSAETEFFQERFSGKKTHGEGFNKGNVMLAQNWSNQFSEFLVGDFTPFQRVIFSNMFLTIKILTSWFSSDLWMFKKRWLFQSPILYNKNSLANDIAGCFQK